MELTRCSNGHFYDAERFTSCPYCNGGTGTDFTETMPAGYEDDNLTVLDDAVNTTEENLKEKINDITAIPDNDKTVSFFDKSIGLEPVVGWLVCTEGEHFGQDFRITGGRNFIGRSIDMDVALINDKSVSRDKHAVLLYEPKANMFLIQPGDSKELFYLNDKVVLQAQEIKAYDVLTLGDTKLMFVPFCGESFQWKKNK